MINEPILKAVSPSNEGGFCAAYLTGEADVLRRKRGIRMLWDCLYEESLASNLLYKAQRLSVVFECVKLCRWSAICIMLLGRVAPVLGEKFF